MFIITFYSFALMTLVLILHFGVEKQVNDPPEGIRIAFFFACMACGATFGIGSVIFYRGMKVGIAPAGGFCESMDRRYSHFPSCSADVILSLNY